jgi:hypothetical protein
VVANLFRQSGSGFNLLGRLVSSGHRHLPSLAAPTGLEKRRWSSKTGHYAACRVAASSCSRPMNSSSSTVDNSRTIRSAASRAWPRLEEQRGGCVRRRKPSVQDVALKQLFPSSRREARPFCVVPAFRWIQTISLPIIKERPERLVVYEDTAIESHSPNRELKEFRFRCEQ